MASGNFAVRHSRLESFLKRHFTSQSTTRRNFQHYPRESVLHYEGCIVCGSNPSKGEGPLPFYVCAILTNYQLMLTDVPPRNLRPLVRLNDIQDIAPVAEAPPAFLDGPQRETVQRFRITYVDNCTNKVKKKQNGKMLNTSPGSSSSSSATKDSDLTCVSTSSSKISINSGVSLSEVVEETIDLLLLSPSSRLGHVLYMTWIRYLMADSESVKKDICSVSNIDEVSRLHWLQNRMSYSNGMNFEKDIKICRRFLQWSTDCHQLSQFFWKDSVIFSWLLEKLYEFDITGCKATTKTTFSLQEQQLMVQLLKCLRMIISFADYHSIWKIIDPLYLDFASWVAAAFKCDSIAGESIDECCAILFITFSMPCPSFASKSVKLLLFCQWEHIIGTISQRIIFLIKQKHESLNDCRTLFQLLYVLVRFLQLDDSRKVLEFLVMKYGCEFRYFTSETWIKSIIFCSSLLKKHIVSLLSEVVQNNLAKGSRNANQIPLKK